MAESLDARQIDAAARALMAGELVAIPTETVYGLAADAGQRDAVAAIYRVKGRPAGHPLIVHVVDVAQARRWAQWPARAQALADAFWPGPLTMILPRLAQAPAWACGDQATVGLRCPSHPVAQALLSAFSRLGGLGVAAPSANRFGRISPTTARHVIDDLGEGTVRVLDGGASQVGLESTIIDLSRPQPVLLRPGSVSLADLQRVLGEPVAVSRNVTDTAQADPQAPRAPGTLASHYAPRTPAELVEPDRLAARLAQAGEGGLRVAVLGLRPPPQTPSAAGGLALSAGSAEPALAPVWRQAPGEPRGYGRCLYGLLRELDESGCGLILVEAPPRHSDWQAVWDRLLRAAHRD